MFERHIDHNHRRGFGQRLPIHIVRHLPAGAVAGDKSDGMVDVAMGRGNARIAKAADTRAHPRNHAERDTGRDQVERFLAAATENERVAAFKTQHPFAAAGELDKAHGNRALLGARLAAPLAGIDPLGAGRKFQNALIHQRVINNDIGLLERIQSVHRQQARIARAGADQPDPPCFEDR